MFLKAIWNNEVKALCMQSSVSAIAGLVRSLNIYMRIYRCLFALSFFKFPFCVCVPWSLYSDDWFKVLVQCTAISPIREACKYSVVRNNEKRCCSQATIREKMFFFLSKRCNTKIFWWLLRARGVQFSGFHLEHFYFFWCLGLFRKLFNRWAALPAFV